MPPSFGKDPHHKRHELSSRQLYELNTYNRHISFLRSRATEFLISCFPMMLRFTLVSFRYSFSLFTCFSTMNMYSLFCTSLQQLFFCAGELGYSPGPNRFQRDGVQYCTMWCTVQTVTCTVRSTTCLYIYSAVYSIIKSTEYTECWPCPLFDILLNKYFPAG